MSMYVIRLSLLLALVISSSGCANFSKIKRDDLNKKSMDFGQRLTPAPPAYITNLGLGAGANGGGCTACAH